MTDLPDDEEFSELTAANFPRVDLVRRGANGAPGFLIMKQDADSAGLMPPELVRDLIAKADADQDAKAEPEPQDRGDGGDGQVTVKGSPAAIAKLMREGALGHAVPDDASAITKAQKYGADDRKKMASSGSAMPDGSYPIKDEEDLKNAIHAVGRGGGSHNAIRKHVITRAKSLGKSSLIPDNWASDGSIKEGSVSKEAETVAKDALGALDLDGITPDAGDLDNGTDGMDPTTPFADPGNLDDLPGDPDDPGSPAWEAIDAATAQKWTAILARAKNALGLLSDREMLEAATVDPDDADNAYDLQDAQCALDFAIGTLAVFAAGEQAETDICTEAMAVSKALAGFDPAALSVVEGLVPVAKAGRVLSAQNESALRSAAESINKVLASLPQAPTADDQVSKEATVAAETKTDAKAAAPAEEEVAKAEETAAPETVTKEDGTEAEAPAETTPPVAAEVSKAADGLEVIVYGKDGDPRRVTLSRVTKAEPGQVAVFGQKGNFVSFARPGDVLKADADAPAKPEQVAVYDSEGNLVGVADPADITPLANVKAPAKNEGDPAEPKPDAAKPADPADLTPAPSADAGTAADGSDDDVAKQATTQTPEADGASTAEPTIAQEVLKGIEDMITAALDKRAPAEDEVAKSAVVAGLREEIEVLKGQVVKLGEQPAMPKVFTNGATPPPGTLRGQDRPGGAPPPVDVAKALERKHQLYTADAPEQNRIAKEMTGDAVAALSAIHGQR